MKNLLLKNPAYLSVENGRAFSYGGNQNWYSKSGRKNGRAVGAYGCGTVAAADFFAYIARQNPLNNTPLTAALQYNNSVIQKESYLEFVSQVYSQYAKPVNHLGMTGMAVAMGLNRYFKDYCINLRAQWRIDISEKRLLRDIAEMLEHDLPVIFVIPALTHLFRPRTLRLRTTFSRQQSGFSGVEYKKIAGHFVTVTGLLCDTAGNPVLQLASWGKKYYVDYSEYRDYIKFSIGALTASIIFVQNRAPGIQQ